MTQAQAKRQTQRIARREDFKVRAQRRRGKCCIILTARKHGGRALVACADTWAEAARQQRSGYFVLIAGSMR